MSRSSTLGGLLLFVAIGVVLSLYGPAIPELRQTFEVGASASGLVLSAHFAGAMVGIAGWALLDRRLGTGASLRLATALLVAGAAGLALAPAWPVVLVAAAVVGVGFGVLVVALNTLFAAGFGNRGAAMLNLLGACFGAGAILGPLAFAATGGFRGPFLGGAVLAVASLPLMRDVRWTPLSELPTGSGRPAPALIGGFVLLYVLYVGVESGVGGWEATSLMAEGAGEAVAANWTAGYWAAITAGRLLAIPLALRVTPPRLVAGSLLLAAASLTLAHTPPLAPLAYTLTGLALAPVFPTGLAWLAAAAPSTRASTALVIAGAQLGGVVLPAVIGRLIDASSPAVIPSTLLAVALACLGTALLLRRSAVHL
ncbi:MAG TPA: MFS transporter [Actinomycetes bacterium]|nr:MFS transporter [Actinomycetes bacterium]